MLVWLLLLWSLCLLCAGTGCISLLSLVLLLWLLWLLCAGSGSILLLSLMLLLVWLCLGRLCCICSLLV